MPCCLTMRRMWGAIPFIILILAAGGFRALPVLRERWLERRRNAPVRTIRPGRARAPRRPATCGRRFTHLLLRVFGSEDDCRHCTAGHDSEPVPFVRPGGGSAAGDAGE